MGWAILMVLWLQLLNFGPEPGEGGNDHKRHEHTSSEWFGSFLNLLCFFQVTFNSLQEPW